MEKHRQDADEFTQTEMNPRFRASLVQELRYGLIHRLDAGVSGLQGFMDGMERALPADVPWLRLENVPNWVPQQDMTMLLNTGVTQIESMHPEAPAERQGWIVVACDDYSVRLIEVSTMTLMSKMTFRDDNGGDPLHIALSPNGQMVAVALNKRVMIWSLSDTGEFQPVRESRAIMRGVSCVAFSPDSRRLAIGGRGHITMWLLERSGIRALKTVFQSGDLWIRNLIICPNYIRFVEVGLELTRVCTIRMDDSSPPEINISERSHSNASSFSQDGSMFAAAIGDNVTVWRFKERVEPFSKRVISDIKGTVFEVRLSNDGTRLAFSSNCELLVFRLTDSSLPELVGTMNGHANFVRALVFTPSGQNIISGGDDDSLRVWSVEKTSMFNLESNRKGHSEFVSSLAFSPNGRLLVSGGADGKIWFWSSVEGSPVRPSVHGHVGYIGSVVFSAESHLFATGSLDQLLKVWTLAENGEIKLEHVCRGHSDSIDSLCFSPDMRLIASASGDDTVRVWSLDEPNIVAALSVFENHAVRYGSVDFSPDGHFLASAGGDSSILLWPLSGPYLPTSIVKVSTYDYLESGVVKFSADGARLAFEKKGHVIGIKRTDCCDGSSADLELVGHRAGIISMIYSPGGRFLASGAHDRTVHIWSIASGECVTKFELAGPVKALWWNDPKRPDVLMAACAMQLRGVHFPVVYRLRLIIGPPSATLVALAWTSGKSEPLKSEKIKTDD